MKDFIKHYKISSEFYDELRKDVLSGNFPKAVKSFRDTGYSIQESREIIGKEFRLEHKLSMDINIYDCIKKIECYPEINNLPISSEIGVLLEFARTQLIIGNNIDIEFRL